MSFSPPARTRVSAGFPSGSLCWAPHPVKAFSEVVVQEVLDNGRVRVAPAKAEDGAPWECTSAELLPRAEALDCKANMDELPELHMAAVLANVEELYNRQQPDQPGCGWSAIYSSVGPVLIAMNPFRPLPLYGPEWARAFREAGNSLNLEWAAKTLGPHCYGTVEQAYQGLRSVKHQSVIICGESGAGKTVTNRKMIEYLLDAEGGSGGVAADKRRIAEANALLEAFGNAKTVRNDNSSRFGKYSQLHFQGEPSKVRGFEIEPYLLEQSRIVSEPRGERNYHIFHQLVRSDLAEELGLQGGPEAFAFTRSGAKVATVDGGAFDDANDFVELRSSMGKAGFADEVQKSIFEAIAGVLHLGNVQIEGSEDTSRVSEASAPALDKACELLGLKPEVVKKALVQQKTSQFTKNLGVKGAVAQRDALAKAVYTRVFTSVVDGINERLQRQGGQASAPGSNATLGLLDIFGFEDMPVNGLEQMYINLTNERIQYLFNTIMFERELQAYRKESIEAAFEAPPSNLPCVELFTAKSPPGLIKILADQVSVNGQDGAALVNILNKRLSQSHYYKMCVPNMMPEIQKAQAARWPNVPNLRYDENFIVRHYAGEVVYTVRDFVSKSRDALLHHLAEVVQGSSKTYVQDLFAQETEGGKLTVGEKFSRQLEALANVLESGGSLFVRCIKPNPRMIPGLVDRPQVLEQLVCGGVVAALEMRKYGFPDRLSYAAFINEFWILDFGLKKKSVPPRKHCEELLEAFVLQGKEEQVQYALGQTKVFMRAGVLALLRANVAERIYKYAVMVQRKWRLKKGLEFIHKLTTVHDRLCKAIEGAKSQGLAEVPNVARAAERAEELMSKVWKSLEESRERHGADTPRTSTPKIAADVSTHKLDVPKLHKLIGELEAAISKVAAWKNKAGEIIARELASAKKEAQVLAERVGKIEASCQGTSEDIPERVACAEACKIASERLDELCRVTLPRLQVEALESVDLSQEPSGGGLCPGARQLLDEAAELVKQAESTYKALSTLRFTFDQEVATLQSKRSDALKRLNALQAQVREAILEGLNGVGEALKAAWDQEQLVAELERAAQDVEGFRRTVEDFETSVARAEQAVQRAASFQENRRREEERQLRAAFEDLEQHEDLKAHGEQLLAVLSAVEQSRSTKKPGNSEEEEASVRLHTKLDRIKDELRSLGIAEADHTNQPSHFDRHASQRLDLWSVSCTHNLGQDIVRHLAKARVLDREVCSSISLAVEGLNAGVLQCDDGYCITYSARAGSYFLLYQQDKRDLVFGIFDLES